MQLSSPIDYSYVRKQLLYSRLLLCKEIGAKMAATKYASFTPNPIAVELGLDDPNGPTAVLAQAMEALSANGSKNETNVLYMYLLDAWEKVFDNELDRSTLEEHMRWFFGKNVWSILNSLCPEIQAIVSGISCVHLGQSRYCDHQTGRSSYWEFHGPH
jgi:paired amphipathic helix protein Sin3a